MLPMNKTKIVCTIGPASESPEVLSRLLRAGMNIARLNFSHGAFDWHGMVIERLRAAARQEGRRLAIMADLPGPKIRVGSLEQEPIPLNQGETLVLTTEEIVGNARRVHVSLPSLPRAVKPGDHLFINDGIIHLEVIHASGNDVACRLLVGGDLRSRKGVNLPGIELGICAFTEQDHACLKFALENGVDAVSQSFVAGPADINAVRDAAAALGCKPFIIAKMERAQALECSDDIMKAADGIMIARGDLGVEIPLETIAIVQKNMMRQANRLGKPVITATHMLDSMVNRLRPTRAEVTDVANAILDGTDAVMLSEESAMGKFPVEAVEMLSRIAASTEPHRPTEAAWEAQSVYDRDEDAGLTDFISRNINHTVDSLRPAAVIVPTTSGHTARMISRFKLPLWIAAVSPEESVCQALQFSYGVHPCCEQVKRRDWSDFARNWVSSHGLQEDGLAVLVQGPSPEHPEANPSLEIITPVTGTDPS